MGHEFARGHPTTFRRGWVPLRTSARSSSIETRCRAAPRLYCRSEGNDQLQSLGDLTRVRDCARPNAIGQPSKELGERTKRQAIKSKRLTTLLPELSSWIIWSRVNPACSPATANFLIALSCNWFSICPPTFQRGSHAGRDKSVIAITGSWESTHNSRAFRFFTPAGA